MNKSKSRKGDIVLKLDLEKAYDRVDWDFLRHTLQLFGFPPVIISLIMHGIYNFHFHFSLVERECHTLFYSYEGSQAG